MPLKFTMKYDTNFYTDQMDGSLSSAQIILPLLLEQISITSAVDIGCGVGTWLSVLLENGVSEVCGLDGDYVDRSLLRIPEESFTPCDLHNQISMEQRYDLAISLEVAEHLPESRAASFVNDLTRLSDCVLFSAAIPEQLGIVHINEQWQSYWADLFVKQGYFPFDLIRQNVWTNSKVEVWYRQNTLVYAKKDSEPFRRLTALSNQWPKQPLNVVHPSMYMQAHQMPATSISRFIRWVMIRTYARMIARIKNRT